MSGPKTGLELSPELVLLRREDHKTAYSEMNEAMCEPCDGETPDFSQEESLMEEGVSMVEKLYTR